MRFKLILLTSLIGAILAAVVSIGMVVAPGGLGSFDYTYDSPYRGSVLWIQLLLFLPPFLIALVAGMFVYRHTAIRRKLQGSVTAVLVVAYCLAAFVLLKLILED